MWKKGKFSLTRGSFHRVGQRERSGGQGWECRRRGGGRGGDKGGGIAGFIKSNIVQRGEREQMAVENVALKAPKKEAMLTDLAVSH